MADFPWLVADVGGTSARFGWVDAEGMRPARVQRMAVADYEGIAAAAGNYLAGISGSLGAAYRAPKWAAIAVATAVDGDDIDFTNSRWRFSRAALARALALDGLLVLNDFEALALALPGLERSQYRCAPQAPAPIAGKALAVIGPGTGLGVAAVVPTLAGWVPIPGEGGHATLAPADDFEGALLARVRTMVPHVSAERLLSGIGLPVLHRALAQELALPAQELTAEAIVQRALDGTDEACGRTLDAFCALLGGFAGNVALTFGARGGVFIGGGIVPRFADRFFASAFRQRFEAKGRFRDYLAAIPTAVITDTLAALGGAAEAIAQRTG